MTSIASQTRWKAGTLVRAMLASWALALPSFARAHGEGAAVVGIAGVDAAGEPWLLRLTEGLALRRDGGWEYLCPAAVELDETIALALGDEERAWVVGRRELYRIDREGRLSRVPPGALEVGRVSQLAALDGRVYALGLAGEAPRGAVLFALEEEGPREVWRGRDAVTSLVADEERLWLWSATDSADRVTLVAVRPGGASEERPLTGWAHGAASVRLRAAGAALYVSGVAGTERFLERVADGGFVPVTTATVALHGPVAADGELFLVVGDVLMRLQDGGLVPAARTLAATALPSYGRELAYVGARLDLYTLPIDEGAIPEPSLRLDGLRAPFQPEPACEAQWLRFEADMQRAGYRSAPARLPERDVREDAQDAAVTLAESGADPDAAGDPAEDAGARGEAVRGCGAGGGTGASLGGTTLLGIAAARTRGRGRRRRKRRE